MKKHAHQESCQEAFTRLSDYLNLELPQDACQEIEAHMEGCAPCIEFTESLRKTVALCQRYEPLQPPTPLRDEARAELKNAYLRLLASRTTEIHPE